MSIHFVIEDESHSEWHSKHSAFAEAVTELQRLALIPWDQPPNLAPCTSWKTCGRSYEIVEYDTTAQPWLELNRIPALEINAKRVFWNPDLER